MGSSGASAFLQMLAITSVIAGIVNMLKIRVYLGVAALRTSLLLPPPSR
jgi:hypothetical protein